VGIKTARNPLLIQVRRPNQNNVHEEKELETTVEEKKSVRQRTLLGGGGLVRSIREAELEREFMENKAEERH